MKTSENSDYNIIPILSEITSSVVGYTDIQSLLDRIVNTTINILNAKVCTIFLEDRVNRPGYIRYMAGSGISKEIKGTVEYKIGSGFTGMVAKTGNEFNIKGPEDPILVNLRDRGLWIEKDKGFKNLTAVPLLIEDRILGVITVENKIGGKPFSDEDLTILRTIATVIALSVQNKIVYQKIEEQSKVISRVLAEVVGAVVEPYKMKDLLNQIIDTTMKTLNAEVCSIFLEDKEKEPNVLKCVAGSGFAEKIENNAKYAIGEGFTGTVAKTGKEYNIRSLRDLQNLVEDGRNVWKGKCDKIQWPSGKNEFRNLIALPLKIKDQTIGVMKVENKMGSDFFTDNDTIILKTIANVIALAIEKTRLQSQVEDQLKTISAMASHRIGNLVTRYDGIERKIRKILQTQKGNFEGLQVIHSELIETTRNVKRMINEFRGYGKPIQLKKESININKIINDEIWFLNIPSNIECYSDLSNKIPNLSIDAARFSESIKELLSNAKRILVQNKNRKGNIFINTDIVADDKLHKKVVKITIADDGPGFPEDFPVFEPFQTTNPKGTGLGLATVKQNIEAHGGEIKLIEKEGMGAYFIITIPSEDSI